MTEAAVLTALERVSAQLAQLEQRIARLESSADNMDEHIGFVNGVYQRVQLPFHKLMEIVGRLSLGGASAAGSLPDCAKSES